MSLPKDVFVSFLGSGVWWTFLLQAFLGEFDVPVAVIALLCTAAFSAAITLLWEKISPRVLLLLWAAAVGVASALVVPVGPAALTVVAAAALGTFFFAAWLALGAVIVQLLRGGLPLPRD